MKIFREKAGVVSKEPLWVCIHKGYIYTGNTLPALLLDMRYNWNRDRRLVMSNKLLTEQELQRECLTRTALNVYGTTPSNLDGDQLGRIAFAAVDLYQFIQSQKLAHGDMVINTPTVEMHSFAKKEYKEWFKRGQEIFKKKQRERNKAGITIEGKEE